MHFINTHTHKNLKLRAQDLPWLFKLPVSEKVEFKEIHCRLGWCCWWLKSKGGATWFYIGYWHWVCVCVYVRERERGRVDTSCCRCQEAATWSRQADSQAEVEGGSALSHTQTHTLMLWETSHCKNVLHNKQSYLYCTFDQNKCVNQSLDSSWKMV